MSYLTTMELIKLSVDSTADADAVIMLVVFNASVYFFVLISLPPQRIRNINNCARKLLYIQ